MVDAGRIAPNVAEKRQHGVAHRRIQRHRGVVIEVNRPRHRRSFRNPHAADEEKLVSFASTRERGGFDMPAGKLILHRL
jgi:hypothetical protein